VGQQPNIELETADLPRPTDHLGAPRRWTPDRAGELNGPADVPHGGRFGSPGPDAGYALTLLADRQIPTVAGEHRNDAVAAIAAVMSARAASFGRAPVVGDAEVAAVILGYTGPSVEALGRVRPAAIAGLAHHASASRTLVAAVDRAALGASLEEVTRRAADGETLLSL
jgi:hypothetical protein